MQVDSVNFEPESVNHMLVSLNGVIQSPTTSYTISGSTITFASALTSSDSIDFIMVYGNVLDIGTPSDATVTNAKTNFVSTSSAAGLQIKGDGTTDGTLQLNCSQNSHGIKLKSPPHSASASYTLTFPNNDGDADQVLTTNGSGVLSWGAGGGTNTPAFSAFRNSTQSISQTTYTQIGFDVEDYDTDGCYNNTGSTVTLNGISTPSYSFAPNVAGKYLIGAAVNGNTSTDFDTLLVSLYKNGAERHRNINSHRHFDTAFCSFIVTANGTSDYFSIYCYSELSGGTTLQASDNSNAIRLMYFNATKLIGV